MGYDLAGTSIDPAVLQRYVEEQIHSLPGTDRHREEFSILLTGSRATGSYREGSDVDIDVLCPQTTYEAVHGAALRAGIIRSPNAFFCTPKDDPDRRYFGPHGAHFSLFPLETVARQIAEYEDVPLWIWSSAKVIEDPGGRFRQLIEGFGGYPREVLIRKIKRHWLASGYWGIDGFSHHHGREDVGVLTSASAMLNSITELLRFFFIVEERPFPYVEKLMFLRRRTRLGAEFCPLLRRMADLVVGRREAQVDAWERLDRVFRTLWCSDQSEQARQLDRACTAAMLAAGVEAEWVEADYGNIDELLTGKLGPFNV